jgi:predicted transcriptional regulator
VEELTHCEIARRLSSKVKAVSNVFDDAEMGKAVKSFRLDVGVHQKLLAAEMGISQAYLSDLECGRRKWNQRIYEKMRDAFDKILK